MFAMLINGLAKTRRALRTRAGRTLVRRVLAGAALSFAYAALAQAGQPVNLRADVSSGPTITLGDLFDDAGAANQIMVGNGAPAGLSAVLDAGEVQRIAHIHGLDWDNPNGLRRIVVRSGEAAANSASSGREQRPSSARMSDVLTYARNLGAGEIIQPQDLVYSSIPTFAAPQDMPRDADAIIGKMVKRPLRAGTPVSARDVSTAQVIKRDDVVQVLYRSGGVSLTLEGKSMGAAGVGDPIDVMNTLSKKVIQAVAVGPDQAVVGPDAEQIREASTVTPTQFAALH